MTTQSPARSLLVRGMLVGLAAGLVAFLLARLIGESRVAAAIAVEGAHAHAEGAVEEPEVFSRGVQRGIGLLTATTLYGIGLGGLFSLVFASTLGRLGRFGARSLAGLLALGGFVTLTLVPFLKYPPNPPAVGDPATIGRRTALYFTMLVVAVLLAVLAVLAGRRLVPRLGAWNATIAAGLGFVVLAAVAGWLMPAVNEVGADFPATTLYGFRIASLTIQASVWATLGLAFGALADRALVPSPAVPASRRTAAASP